MATLTKAIKEEKEMSLVFSKNNTEFEKEEDSNDEPDLTDDEDLSCCDGEDCGVKLPLGHFNMVEINVRQFGLCDECYDEFMSEHPNYDIEDEDTAITICDECGEQFKCLHSTCIDGGKAKCGACYDSQFDMVIHCGPTTLRVIDYSKRIAETTKILPMD